MKTTPSMRTRNVFPSRDRRRRRGLLIPAVTLLALSLGSASNAGQVTLSVTPSVSTTAATGSFEVDLTNTSGSDVTVSAFSIQLDLSNLTGVVFTGVSTATTTGPYIFTGVGGEAFLGAGFQFSFSTFPGTDLIASDSDFLSSIPAGGTRRPSRSPAEVRSAWRWSLSTRPRPVPVPRWSTSPRPAPL